MRNIAVPLALLALSATLAGAEPADNRVVADYLEARTASVFSGACHYNGEIVTVGREAQMLWHIRTGSYKGVSLKGLNAMVAVVSEDNLKNTQAKRRSVMYLDAKATEAQADALTEMILTTGKSAIGDVVAIKHTTITFKREADTFSAEVVGISKVAVKAMPNKECCRMPNNVWYEPLVKVQNRRVGYTDASGVKEKCLKTDWMKSRENSAFYGTTVFM